MWALPFSETDRLSASIDKRVEPPSAGYDIQLSQSAASDRVTLTFVGGAAPPVVRIDNQPTPLPADRRISFDLAAGTTMVVDAAYPAVPGADQELRLPFDFDKPQSPGWSVEPPSSGYRGYLANRTSPVDTRFETSTAGGGQRGAEAVRAWLNGLGSPKRVRVDAYTSFDGDVSKAAVNMALSQRRLDVALGIIGESAQVTGSEAHGFQPAHDAGRIGDPTDRVAVIRGASAGAQAVAVHATLTRPAGSGTGTPGPGTPGPGTPGPGTPGPGTPGPGTPGPGTPGPGTPGPGTPGPGTPGPGTPGPGTPGPGTPGPGTPGPGTPGPGAPGPGVPPLPPAGIKLAFSLQKIEQIEDKSVTFSYSRQDAVQRVHAPQGLLRLLAEDLDGPPHFIEVDLDSPFLRTLDLQVEAPPGGDRVGLLKSDVAIEYGRLAEPVNLRHKDISFRPAGSTVERASFFLDQQLDLDYRYTVQYHFDPLSGWDGERLSYELPTATTFDRTLLITPYRDFGFLEVQIIVAELDPAMIDSTDVVLHYEDPGRWGRDKLVTVRPDSPPQTWKLRLTDPRRREYSYRFVHRLKDGTTTETPPVLTSAASVAVNDPFEDPLVVEFFPNYDPAGISILFVDVTFVDPPYPARTQQLRFTGTAPQAQRLRFARTDRGLDTITFQITVLGTDNSVRRLAGKSTESSIVFLGEHMA